MQIGLFDVHQKLAGLQEARSLVYLTYRNKKIIMEKLKENYWAVMSSWMQSNRWGGVMVGKISKKGKFWVQSEKE